MNDTALPPATTSHAAIATENASRYLQQLCKHFAHKIPVSFDETQGRITFDMGECRLSATGSQLRLEARAQSPESLPTLEDVVARHLVRFAFREELAVTWVTGAQP